LCLVKLTIKMKSLENHYFVNNASPAKDALNKRSELQWTHLNLSSTFELYNEFYK